MIRPDLACGCDQKEDRAAKREGHVRSDQVHKVAAVRDLTLTLILFFEGGLCDRPCHEPKVPWSESPACYSDEHATAMRLPLNRSGYQSNERRPVSVHWDIAFRGCHRCVSQIHQLATSERRKNSPDTRPGLWIQSSQVQVRKVTPWREFHLADAQASGGIRPVPSSWSHGPVSGHEARSCTRTSQRAALRR